MKSIRILDDENRLYIVIDNPTPADKKDAMNFVSKKMGAEIEEEKPRGVFPPKVEAYQIPNDLREIEIRKDENVPTYCKSTKEFNEWYVKRNDYAGKQQEQILFNCRCHLLKRLKGSSRSNMEFVKSFLVEFYPSVSKTVDKIIKMNGYKNLNSFLETEGDLNIQAAYDRVLRELRSELNIK